MTEQSGRAIFDEVGDEFEAGIAAVVGVGDFVMLVGSAEVGELTYFGAVLIGLGELDNVGVVFIIHGENEVEYFEVAEAELPGGAGDFVAPTANGFGHAGVGCLAGVEADGSGGVAVDFPGEAGFLDEMAEDIFSCGRAADIAHTNEDEIIAAFHETNARTPSVPLTGKEL